MPYKLTLLKEEQRVMPGFSEKQVVRIVSWKPKGFYQGRLHTLILTILDSGLRINELLRDDIRDVEFDSMLIKVQGKGRKERFVPFSYELRKFLWRWNLRPLVPNPRQV